ncbi:MAG TPA: HlyD family efflux transporter periplasmic adaptor subunit [Candidatus Lachnoclostridium stercoravium]|uniref:HlyD family efflux transporter periplasmic adaptor subunit n=1 Tax=Candidatus Lachnoclostridium stercoravium TaxID=2838633 RepID=A0A9D2HHI1_9FIRM|nr:HlyD family efflux transporter periplasmic adaptor subunit [Candidatus Lachnoclostridium stercoravium]
MENESRIKKLLKKRPSKRQAIILLVAAAVAAGFFLWSGRAKQANADGKTVNTAKVERRSISSELSASGSLSAKDSYNITSLVEGEVLSADFEEGDEVTKDQVLYVIDSSSMETQLKLATTSLENAQENYDDAVEDYNEAISKFSGNTYKSTRAGFIRTLYIEAGDKVSAQTQIADIYDDTVMKLKVPFLAEEAVTIPVGAQVTVTLSDTGEVLAGTVTNVSNMDETMTGGRIVRYVHIEVANPGGLTTDHTAVVTYGNMTCSQEANFEPKVETTLTAEDLGANVDIETLLVAEGDYVNKGTALFRMTASSAEDMIRSYENDMNNAQQQVQSAESNLESTQDSYDNYTITAPISGQVIAKNVKVGEKISRNSGSADTTLAVIYDLSSLTFEMSIDELDISNVKEGQKVNVQADAFEDRTYTGTVTNVSMEGSYSNGVTNYPVTVTLDTMEDLLPGMNVDGTIILDEASDVLTIPVDALMRGDIVYVKDSSSAQAAVSAGPVEAEEAKGDDAGPKEGAPEGSAADASGAEAGEAPEAAMLDMAGVPEGFHAVKVETGLVNDSFVEIISGLSEGDEVYVDSASRTSSDSFTMPQGGMGPGMGGGPEGGPGGNMGGGRP